MRRYTTLAVAVLFVLSACMHTNSGTQIGQEQLSQIKEGKTKKSDVIELLGNPAASGSNSDGTSEIVYAYASSEMDGKAWIPFAGPFISTHTYETQTVNITFDRNDVVQKYTVSKSSGQSGYGR
jgi:outer membrane protein assembly factor BamE (lipoprotein component of BamABCDE complex)